MLSAAGNQFIATGAGSIAALSNAGIRMVQGKRTGVAENETPHEQPAPQQAAVTQSDLLTLYGIKAVTSISYEWGGYRYTNASDAISAAKRGVSG